MSKTIDQDFELDYDYYSEGGRSIGHGFQSNMSGITGLMASILHRAYLDLTCNDKLQKRTARLYFASRDTTYCFSFLRICEHLKVPPAKLMNFLIDKHLL